MKTKKNSNIRDLFTSGHIQDVYKIFLKGNYLDTDFTWVLGSLCFLGKLDEAVSISKKRKLKSAEYFLLLTAAIRSGDDPLTKTLFKNLSKLKSQSVEDKFFYTQALAFYAYYKCRYKNCLTIVMRSRALSLELSESFWKILALDLLGHTHMQMGNVHKAIMHLEEARTLAAILENITFLQATEMAIITYQAQFTSQPKAHIALIEKKLRQLSKNDNYSESSFMLSLAHLYLLTGEQNEADKILTKSQKVIFSSTLSRHKALWSFEKAYFYYLEGSYDLALNYLMNAEEFTNVEIEKKAFIKILGLRRAIYSLLEKNTQPIDLELIKLTKITGDALSINKLARINLLPPVNSEDPLQKTFEQFSTKDWKNSLPDIIQYEYYGLLRNKLADKKSAYLITGLWKKGVVILTRSGLLVKPEGISEMLLKALILLSTKKSVSKEELVSNVWGLSYDPLRHDTSVYTLIHRLRDILGPLQKDLTGENHSYSFTHDFNHLDMDSTPTSPVEMLHSTYKNEHKWNIRQHKALRMIRDGQSFKVSEYALEFNVSIITALRDLTELKNANQVNSYGRARATTYAE